MPRLYPNIYVGNSTFQWFELEPGAALTMEWVNQSSVYVIYGRMMEIQTWTATLNVFRLLHSACDRKKMAVPCAYESSPKAE